MKTITKSIFALACASAVCMQANQQANPKMPVQTQVPNPSARWGVTAGANLFITAEALVFKIAQDTLPYAWSETASGNQWTDYHTDFDYKWGFRVAAGYNIPHDKWDVVGTYVRFNVNSTVTTQAPALGDLYTYSFNGVDAAQEVSSVSNKWYINFNEFDIEQGRQFFVSKYLRLRPKFGLRNLFLDNNQTNTVVDTQSVTTTIKNNVHFWGMGVLAGLDTVWTLGQGVSIYGNVALAGLFGYFNPKISSQVNEASTFYQTSGHLENTKGNLDLALGLRWDRNFYNDRYHVGFNFGFEEHVFFNMNQAVFADTPVTSFSGLSGRDFTLSGFAFGARFDF